MEDQVLSIKQMQRLIELGVDVSKASMCYVFFESDGSKYADIVVHDESCYEMACMNPMPTFTLQDMINIMPNSIEFDGVEYYLCIDKNGTEYIDLEEDPIYWYNGNSILINTYSVLVWLAKNKYI